MTHTYTSFHAHFIWGTKYRTSLIQPAIQKPLYNYIGGIIKDKPGCLLIAAGGIPNHIHLLVRLSAQQSPATLVRGIKSLSAQFIHKNFPEFDFVWQAGYGGFAVSESLIEKVKSYIERQEEHHLSCSFEKEFESLLKKHNLIIENGLWDDNK